MCTAIETPAGNRYYGIGSLREANWTIPDDIYERLRADRSDEPWDTLDNMTDQDIDDSCFCGIGDAIEIILEANGATWRIEPMMGDYYVQTGGPEHERGDPHQPSCLGLTGGGRYSIECWCGHETKSYTTKKAAQKAHERHAKETSNAN